MYLDIYVYIEECLYEEGMSVIGRILKELGCPHNNSNKIHLNVVIKKKKKNYWKVLLFFFYRKKYISLKVQMTT